MGKTRPVTDFQTQGGFCLYKREECRGIFLISKMTERGKHMIKRELRSLTHNKILLLVVAAITVIPFIYAGLFLKSMWDPYGSL